MALSTASANDDIGGSKKFRALLRNAARKVQEKLIVDAQQLVSSGFMELPAVINLSFVLENVAGAVKECHIQKSKADQPISTLFDWVWNESEIPSLIVLGSWWLCALLTQGRCPVGRDINDIGPMGEQGMKTLKRAEEVSLRGLAKLFSTILSNHTTQMKHHGGAAAQRATHAVFSSILPDAIARATRDCAFLTWPHLRLFLEKTDCCVALVGIWSYLITGDKGAHIFAKNIHKSKVKTWGIPTDLAPTQLHLRRAEADQPSTFPALERRRKRERKIRERVQSVRENNKLLSLPYHEREVIERMKLNAKSTDSMGIPLKPPDPLARNNGPPRMKHGRFVLGRSPLVQLALANIEVSDNDDLAMSEIGEDIATIATEFSPLESPLKESDRGDSAQDGQPEKKSVITRRLSLTEMLTPPAPPTQSNAPAVSSTVTGVKKYNNVLQRAEFRKQNMPKRGEMSVSLTFAPPIYEVQSLFQKVSTRTVPGPNASSVDTQQEAIPSLYASLVENASAIRPLGEAPDISTYVTPNQWSREANRNMKPLKKISTQRVHLKRQEASEERAAQRQARADRVMLEKRRAAVLDSKLDVIDHARRTLEQALDASPAPVSMVQVHKVMDYHSEHGTLPRHHAVRLESFSRR